MQQTDHRELQQLIEQLGETVGQGASIEQTVQAVKRLMLQHLDQPGWLPESCQQEAPGCYARHLVHRDPQERFTMVAMVWAPGQQTPVHDHAGVWCVEGVYRGCLQVTRYDRLDSMEGDVARFHRHDKLEQGIGCAGALIPPVEYHTIENPYPKTAVTVHVYGADMKWCRAFLPREDGAYEACVKELQYTSVWNALAGAGSGSR